MPTPQIPIEPAQVAALRAHGRELLIAAEPLSGASYALRALAIARAWETPHTTVYLTSATDETLRADHLFEGPSSLWGMVAPLVAAGSAVLLPGRVIRLLSNGSTIIPASWDRASRANPDVLLVDHGDAMPFALWAKLLDRVGRTPSDKPRAVITAQRPNEGWIGQLWNGHDPGRARVELKASDLPPEILASIPKPKPLLSFGDYIDLVLPSYRWYRHTEFMVEQAQRLVIPRPGEGKPEISRLGVLAPSRHFKSLTFSSLLPAWRMYRRPEDWCFGVASDDLLALKFSQDCRTFFAQGGGAFRVDQKSAELWRTPRGGGMLARTLKQGFMGFGFNHLTLDDPYGSYEAAQNTRIQEDVDSKFWNTIYNRRERDTDWPATIVVVMHRLARGDIFGRLMKREADAQHPPEGWYVLDLQAIKRREKREPYPPSVTVIDDGRAEGEPVCPEVTSLEEWAIEKATNSETFEAMAQQDPLEIEGSQMFRRSQFQFVDAAPAKARRCRGWDAAATEGGGDWMVGIKIAELDGIIYIEDERRGQWGPGNEDKEMRATAELDGKACMQREEREPGSSGKVVISARARLLAGFDYAEVLVGKNKVLRARPFRAQCETGNVRIVRGPWNDEYIKELERFPFGENDDRVDATSAAYNSLVAEKPKGDGRAVW